MYSVLEISRKLYIITNVKQNMSFTQQLTWASETFC